MDSFPMPVGRNGRPEEIANLICYLLGPDARFIVGSVIFIDGGTDALFRADDFPTPMPIPTKA
jgi:NAD(P)-dependent dehydrogenase (short-subunit alcohol dehydrogenase family)